MLMRERIMERKVMRIPDLVHVLHSKVLGEGLLNQRRNSSSLGKDNGAGLVMEGGECGNRGLLVRPMESSGVSKQNFQFEIGVLPHPI